MTVDETGDVDARHSTALLELATPELFRENPFRITGLPRDATTVDIRGRRKEIRLAEALETPVDHGTSPFPLTPPPTTNEVRAAFTALENPERRLLAELFWLWAPAKDPASVDAADPIERTHDVAVEAHLVALDLELEGMTTPLGDEQADRRDLEWYTALDLWWGLCNDADLWSRLRERVAEIDDVRLTTGTLRRVRHTLPTAILRTIARTAVQAGNAETARRLQDLVRESPFPESVIDEVFAECAQPARRAVDHAVTAAKDRIASATGVDAMHDILRQLDVQTEPALRTISHLLGPDHRTTEQLTDAVVEVSELVAVHIHNLAGDEQHVTSSDAVRAALAVLVLARDRAIGVRERDSIDGNIRTMAANLVGIAVRRYLDAGRPGRAAAFLRNWRRAGDEPAVLDEIDRWLADPQGNLVGTIDGAPSPGCLFNGIGMSLIPGRSRDDGRFVASLWFSILLPLIPIRSYLGGHNHQGMLVYYGSVTMGRFLWWWRLVVPLLVVWWLPLRGDAVGLLIVIAIVVAFLLGREHWFRYRDRATLGPADQPPYRPERSRPSPRPPNSPRLSVRLPNVRQVVVRARASVAGVGLFLKRYAVVTIGFLVLVASALSAAFLEAPGSSAPATVPLFSLLTADNPPPGTCIATAAMWSDQVAAAGDGCNERHWGEVVGYPVLGPFRSPYPGTDQTFALAWFGCEQLLAAHGLATDRYTAEVMWPDESTWNDGAGDQFENYSTCAVRRSDDQPLPATRVVDPGRSPRDDVVVRMSIFSPDVWANPPVGTCVQEGSSSGQLNVYDLPIVSCAQPHWAEILGYPSIYEPGSTWPGDDAVRNASSSACDDLATRRGLSVDFAIDMVWPSREWWDSPTQGTYATCLAYRVGDATFAGPAR